MLSNGPPPGREGAERPQRPRGGRRRGRHAHPHGPRDWSSRRSTRSSRAARVARRRGAHGLRGWLWLGDAAEPAAPAAQPSPQRAAARAVVDGVQGPCRRSAPTRGSTSRATRSAARTGSGRPGSCARYQRLQALDPTHPVVIIQAPISTVAAADAVPARVRHHRRRHLPGLVPARHARADGEHATSASSATCTKKMVQAAGPKPVWMTLQIAWSGVAPSQRATRTHVPRFPTLHHERFMAYQAIVNGARGLVFFGGHLTQVATPADAAARLELDVLGAVLRPLVRELSSPELAPALVAPNAKPRREGVDAGRRARHAARRRRTSTSSPCAAAARRAASRSPGCRRTDPRAGEVLFEYVQRPLPPPIGAGSQVFRPVDGRPAAAFATGSRPTTRASTASGSS